VQEKRPVAETQNITPWEEDEGTEEVEEVEASNVVRAYAR
jgi:hypothetical protein